MALQHFDQGVVDLHDPLAGGLDLTLGRVLLAGELAPSPYGDRLSLLIGPTSDADNIFSGGA
jgi:hypothetical protein